MCWPKGTVKGATASITINPTRKLGPVNRFVFGQNMETGDNARIFSSDTTNLDLIRTGGGFWNPTTRTPVPSVLAACSRVGTSVLRYPGGCLAHNFDWRRTVGPQAKRAGWTFGLDEYLALCASLGAQPIITVSDYVLPASEMPANAASMVEYLNAPADEKHPFAMQRKANGHALPYGVKWFELGNESIHGNHRLLPPRKYSPQDYVDYANATAAAMRRVDPTIKIGIVTVPGDAADVQNDWNQTVIRGAGQNADFVVVHLYLSPTKGVFPGGAPATGQAEARLMSYHTLIKRSIGHDLPLAITEFNGPAPERDTFQTALLSADLLRVFLEPGMNILEANYWEFFNGAFGMLQSQGGGGGFKAKPAFELFTLWHEHFGNTLVSVGLQGLPPGVTATASTGANGRIYLIVINQGRSDASANLTIAGANPSKVTMWQRTSSTMPDALTAPRALSSAGASAGYSFPAMSMTAVEVSQ